MLLDLGHAAEDTGPLPNHESRKPLSMETPGLANARRTFVRSSFSPQSFSPLPFSALVHRGAKRAERQLGHLEELQA